MNNRSDRTKGLQSGRLGKKSVISIILYFIQGISGGAVSMRASAIAFQLLLAAPPVVILLLSLVPYLPVEHVQAELYEMLQTLLPGGIFAVFESLLTGAVGRRPALSFLGFGFSLLFATNGLDTIIRAFDSTAHEIQRRSLFDRRIVSLILAVMLFFLFIAAALFLVISKTLIRLIIPEFPYFLFIAGRWILSALLIYGFVTVLCLFAPAVRPKWKEIQLGAAVATVSIVIASIAFSFIVSQFGHFTRLFGSLGTLIVTLLWLKMNALAVILGFELNMSVST